MRHHGRRWSALAVLVGLLLSVVVSGPASAATVAVSPSAWTTVSKSFPTTTYYRWTGADNGVGFVSTASTVETKRFLLAFPTATFTGKNVTSAHLRVYETWSYSCTTRGVEAWRTGSFGSTTTWSSQPAWSSRLAATSVAYGRDGCTPGGAWVDFDVTAAASALAVSGGSTLYLGVRASSETDTLGWKRFQSNASLTVAYQ